MTNLQSILNRIVTDQAFCTALINDPVTTLVAAGIEPTPQLTGMFDNLDLPALRATVQPLC